MPLHGFRNYGFLGSETFTAPTVVTSGLLVYWDADNPNSYPKSGTSITDLSGNGRTGTISGSVSYVNNGLYGSYWNFSRSDSNYIYTTSTAAYLDCTIIFYPDLTLPQGLVGLVADSTPAAGNDNSMRFEAPATPGQPWTISSRNPGDLNDWAYSSGTTYYKNNVGGATAVSSGWNIWGGYRTNQSSYPQTGALYIGSSGYPGRGFSGRISAVLMYNRQLSAAEHTTNFNAFKARYSL